MDDPARYEDLNINNYMPIGLKIGWIWWGGFLSWLLLIFGICLQSNTVCTVGAVGCLVAILPAVLILPFAHFRYHRDYNEIYRRLDEVPISLRVAANEWYGDGWQDAALECHESHMGGDCPLCGAN